MSGKLPRIVAFAGAAAVAGGALCYIIGIRINTTKSIPLGVYLTTDTPVTRGAYITFCPPPSDAFLIARDRIYIAGGQCPGGFGFLMKRVLAAKGDTVAVTEQGVFVNGKILPLSQPRKVDLDGRELPTWRPSAYTLADEVLPMSDVSATSFDGRYFGPVQTKQIVSVIRPLITW